MTEDEFFNMVGELPVDVFGEDWETYLELETTQEEVE